MAPKGKEVDTNKIGVPLTRKETGMDFVLSTNKTCHTGKVGSAQRELAVIVLVPCCSQKCSSSQEESVLVT